MIYQLVYDRETGEGLYGVGDATEDAWSTLENQTFPYIVVPPDLRDTDPTKLRVRGGMVTLHQLTKDEQIAEQNALARDARQRAFATEADPLFFKAQRGEVAMYVYLGKVAEIRARFPYYPVTPANGEDDR